MASDFVDAPPPPHRLATLSAQTKAAIAALFLSVAPLLLAHVAFTPRYQTNDDAYMTMVACGAGACDHPDSHLIVINALLGSVLASLYSQWPALPWYRLTMCGFQFVASFITYLALLRGSPTAWRFLLCFCYMLGFDLYAYVNPQFTITSELVMQAGIIVYLSWAESRRPTAPLVLLFVGTVAVSCCIRELSCAMLLVLGVPAFVVPLLPESYDRGYSKDSAKRFGTVILRLAAPLALGGTTYVLLMIANWSPTDPVGGRAPTVIMINYAR